MKTATVIVTTIDRASFFSRETQKTFSFDSDEFSYPPELDDYLAVALCGRKSISIDFQTEETAMVSNVFNKIIARVSGYSEAIDAGDIEDEVENG
jgi:hypothetical protein